MRQEITAKVRFNPDNPQVLVRKALFKEDGKVDTKYFLSKEGDWIEVPEATPCPEECYLPVALYPPFPKEQKVELRREKIAEWFYLEQLTPKDYKGRYPCWEELRDKQPFLNKADSLLAYIHTGEITQEEIDIRQIALDLVQLQQRSKR